MYRLLSCHYSLNNITKQVFLYGICIALGIICNLEIKYMRALDGEPITQVTEAERLLESRRQGLLGQYSKTLSQKQQQQTLKSRRMCVGCGSNISYFIQRLEQP